MKTYNVIKDWTVIVLLAVIAWLLWDARKPSMSDIVYGGTSILDVPVVQVLDLERGDVNVTVEVPEAEDPGPVFYTVP